MEPKVVRPGDVHHISLYDVTFRYGVGSAESDGRLSMLEVTIPPKTLIKPHMHTLEDEYTLILAGTVGACLGDNTVEEIPAGSWLVKPRSIRHAMWNVSGEPARILEVVIPGGLESYFEQIAPILHEHGPDWTKRYKRPGRAVRPRHPRRLVERAPGEVRHHAQGSAHATRHLERHRDRRERQVRDR